MSDMKVSTETYILAPGEVGVLKRSKETRILDGEFLCSSYEMVEHFPKAKWEVIQEELKDQKVPFYKDFNEFVVETYMNRDNGTWVTNVYTDSFKYSYFKEDGFALSNRTIVIDEALARQKQSSGILTLLEERLNSSNENKDCVVTNENWPLAVKVLDRQGDLRDRPMTVLAAEVRESKQLFEKKLSEGIALSATAQLLIKEENDKRA